MKQKNEMASKAGNPKTENSKNLLSVISKSASMLLIIMTGLGTMSFTQDDTSVNGIDTNQNVKKAAVTSITMSSNNECCNLKAVAPGDEIRNAYYISLPDNKIIARADAENISKFIAASQMRRLWNMDIATARKEADAEMNFNFGLRNIYPSTVVAQDADVKMIDIFADDIVLKNVKYTTAGLAAADIEVADNFVTAQLSENNIFSTEECVAKSDAELKNDFVAKNMVMISLPSKIAADNADNDMLKKYQVQYQLTETVVTK
ncbi:MAG: hypothetical protein JST63_05710 [Bacteroidetes bacterium]|nr:hypothetical protein [Bacteroidota bacterium]